ncbi:MAG TPA: S26 family signal peptidase [Candidatus Saccharimonadia bacterium]|nr:S26 family signal peptidase [Candidatus Saccharimonadia bacterium]
MLWSLPLTLRRVVGPSMYPTLKNNQIVLAWKSKNYSVNDIVIFSLNNREIIKRISDMNHNLVYVLGDNLKSSIDSRKFGWINLEDIKYKIILKK